MMKWSWKIGRFAGIDAFVHASFLLLVGWAAWAAYAGAGTGLAALLGVLFLLAVFASVLLHELGHALMARRFGIRTRRIVLLPIGGVAQLEGEPRTPKQELAVALAGPAVNFVLAAGLFGIVQLFGLPAYGLLGSLMLANLTLGAFNLVPAFPMDGGRALRALLATRLGGRRATRLAIGIGKAAAIGLAVAGLFTNWMLTLVGVFVWFAADAEAKRRDAVYGGTGFSGVSYRRPARGWFAEPLSRWTRPRSSSTRAHGWTAYRRADEPRATEPPVIIVYARRIGI